MNKRINGRTVGSLNVPPAMVMIGQIAVWLNTGSDWVCKIHLQPCKGNTVDMVVMAERRTRARPAGTGTWQLAMH